jgi:hypothetical protein
VRLSDDRRLLTLLGLFSTVGIVETREQVVEVERPDRDRHPRSLSCSTGASGADAAVAHESGFAFAPPGSA